MELIPDLLIQMSQQIFSIWKWMMDHLLYINLILSVVIVFFQRRDPKAVWTWLLALYFVPIFGFLLYLLLCQDFRKNKMFRVKEVEDRLRYSVKTQEAAISGREKWLLDPRYQEYEKLVLYNLETSGAVLTGDNQVQIFTDGEEKFNDLIQEMEQAKEYIAQEQFAKGSMLPKVEAAIRFAQSGEGRHALITLLDKAAAGIAGETGTVIHS